MTGFPSMRNATDEGGATAGALALASPLAPLVPFPGMEPSLSRRDLALLARGVRRVRYLRTVVVTM